MDAQGRLFERKAGDGVPPPPRATEPEPAPVWMQRLSLVVLVMFCFLVGGLLILLPWSTYYWDENGWMMAHPVAQAALSHGWVRGVVSGIGLLDVWIGVSELLGYRDYRV